MSLPTGFEDLSKLKSFVDFVSENPSVLNLPQLNFFKRLIEKFGGHICPDLSENKDTGKPKFQNENDEDGTSSSDSAESALDLDLEGVIIGDAAVEQFMGDPNKKPTEAEIDLATDMRAQAAAVYAEQKYHKAIELYTSAITLNPGNALFFAKRGQVFLKLMQPHACIRDCCKALELNCDSAAAYKFRGRANRLIGNWEEAVDDLRQACKLDFDEETDEWLREVTPNAIKIVQYRKKMERKRAKHNRKNDGASEEPQKAANCSTTNFSFDGVDIGGFNIDDLISVISDPEMAAAMDDIAKNPANIEMYKSNPKLAKIFKEINNISADFTAAGASATANTDQEMHITDVTTLPPTEDDEDLVEIVDLADEAYD